MAEDPEKMPTYEYACKACGEHLEVVQSFKDDALTTCPACGGSLRKVFGSIGIAFKGSGFYRTDSRSGPPKEKEQEKKAASSESSSSGDKSSTAAKSSGSEKSSGPEKSAGSGKSSGAGGDKAAKPTSSTAASA
jgi:putative FmdB family regulatory protein